MSDRHKGILLAVTLTLGVSLALISLGKQYQCRQSWLDSGYDYRWKAFAGCQLMTEDGRWIPAENYRERHEIDRHN